MNSTYYMYMYITIILFLEIINSFLIGIPAIYMAIIVPIGFLVQTSDLNENTHFLYQTNNLISAYADFVHMY